MVNLETEIYVECNDCRRDLDCKIINETIFVEPCAHCLDMLEGLAYEDGYKDGQRR